MNACLCGGVSTLRLGLGVPVSYGVNVGLKKKDSVDYLTVKYG